MSRRGLSVEFVGLPGSGKSTLSRRVAELVGQSGLPVRETAYTLGHGRPGAIRTLRKGIMVLQEVLTHPGCSLSSARIIGATRQTSLGTLFRMLFNWLLVSALLRRSRGIPGVHLLDQGVYQALWSIGLDGGADAVRRAGRDLASRLPGADVVVLVESTGETVADRLRKRGGRDSRADSWCAEDTDAFGRAAALLDQVKALIATAAKSPCAPAIVSIDNEHDSDLERNAALLAGEIERRMRGGAA